MVRTLTTGLDSCMKVGWSPRSSVLHTTFHSTRGGLRRRRSAIHGKFLMLQHIMTN